MNRYINVLTIFFISSCVFALSGCGQKGDLYLPAIPPAPIVVETGNEIRSSNIDRSNEAKVEKENVNE